MSYPSNQNNAHTYGWPPNPRFFFLPRSPLFCIRPYLSLSFWPVARSTSRCRQLTTRGLGCDHKTHKSVKEDLWNPSTRPREKIQNSDESRRGASMREQCRRVHPHLLFFFPTVPPRPQTRPSRKSVHVHGDHSAPISRCLEGTIDRPSSMNAILSQFSSTFVREYFFCTSLQFYES